MGRVRSRGGPFPPPSRLSSSCANVFLVIEYVNREGQFPLGRDPPIGLPYCTEGPQFDKGNVALPRSPLPERLLGEEEPIPRRHPLGSVTFRALG